MTSSLKSLVPVFPDNVGSINTIGQWSLLSEHDCEYYNLNTADGIPQYITNPMNRNHILFKMIYSVHGSGALGEGGNGVALKVLDSKIPIVLKIALDNFLSVRERTIGSFINRWILTGRRSPNFVKSLFEFICPGLPPAEGEWKKIVNYIQRVWVPKFQKLAMSSHYRKDRPAALSYLGLELGTSGDFFDFANRGLGKDMVASFGFQMFFGLAALHETDIVHKDIQDQNVVVSQFSPQMVKDVPLYRIQKHGDFDWVYADPYLTRFEPSKKSHFLIRHEGNPEATKNHHFYYTVKFIDYGGTLRLPKEFPHVIMTHGFGGVVDAGPPELLFVDREAKELMTHSEKKKKKKMSHPAAAPYSKASDVWSTAVIIAGLALAGEHIFMDSRFKHAILRPWLFFAPDVVVKDMKLVYNDKNNTNSNWMRSYTSYGYVMLDGIHLMWNMVEALGLPTNADWPGIEKSNLWKTIVLHKKLLKYGTSGGWFWARKFTKKNKGDIISGRIYRLNQVLGDYGRRLLFKDILVWDPSQRSSAFEVIIKHPYFSRIYQAGKARGTDPQYSQEDNIWGFKEGWMARAENKTKMRKQKEAAQQKEDQKARIRKAERARKASEKTRKKAEKARKKKARKKGKRN